MLPLIASSRGYLVKKKKLWWVASAACILHDIYEGQKLFGYIQDSIQFCVCTKCRDQKSQFNPLEKLVILRDLLHVLQTIHGRNDQINRHLDHKENMHPV